MRKDLKEAESSGVAGPVQITLRTAIKSKDLREEFILYFIKMCTVADIPLQKTEKMMPFLRNTASKVVLCHSHRVLGPGYRLFDQYYQVLKELLQSSSMPIYIIAEETTDVRDKSVRNVLVGMKGTTYLIGVEQMEVHIQSGNPEVSWRCWDLLQPGPWCGDG